MIALDTNVWARAFLGDDPAQSAAARAAIEKGAQGKGVFVPLLVLVELYWVLKSAPGWDAARVHQALGSLLEVEGVEVDQAAMIREALELSTGAVGLADNLLALMVKAQGCTKFLTFDTRLAKTGRASLLKA
ncbi:PIN domain-containing protein [Holophaga foetida]|uniref:PIN domain-containing protein n=1 Tax=Holophaga foetida TaxID=35839 RepID=UPI000247183A|nr:PIN domain-containing protein [Holophaga foetida]